jgi:hypothetical protein
MFLNDTNNIKYGLLSVQINPTFGITEIEEVWKMARTKYDYVPTDMSITGVIFLIESKLADGKFSHYHPGEMYNRCFKDVQNIPIIANESVNFYRDCFEGQMNPEERTALYSCIRDIKPKRIVEVGTCRGGGSTYYIASAIMDEKIICDFNTTENFMEFYDYARKLYGSEGPLYYLNNFIHFHFESSLFYLKKFDRQKTIDVLMIDGGYSSHSMLYEFVLGKQFMPIGSFLICHDWDNGKSNNLKPVIENDHDWKLVSLTVALVIYQRVGNFYDV